MIINERSKEKNMQKQIALLRGINVSGKNKIVMKDLKAEFGKLGYENAATLLNSGNIVFESAERDEKLVGKNGKLAN